MKSFLNRNHLKYGLLMCASLVICLFLMEATGQNESFENKSPIFLVYQFIVPAFIWYFGIKAKKDASRGKLTFKEGVAEGFKISVVFALVSPFIFATYYFLINPDILNYVKSTYNLSDSTNEVVVAIDMLAQFVAAMLFGTLYGTIISFFLKSKGK